MQYPRLSATMHEDELESLTEVEVHTGPLDGSWPMVSLLEAVESMSIDLSEVCLPPSPFFLKQKHQSKTDKCKQ